MTEDRPVIGATSGSIPRPDLSTRTVYQPVIEPRVETEIQTSQRLTALTNRQDILKLRLDLQDEVLTVLLRELLRENNFDDVNDLLTWFLKHKEGLVKEYNKIS